MIRTLALASFLSASVAFADEAPPSWKVSVETDPLDYFEHGYAAWVGVRAPALPRLRLTAGTRAFQFPSYVVELNPGNKGWSSYVRSYELFGQYFFGEHRGGFFVGLGAAYGQYTLTAPDGAGSTQVGHFGVALEGGYQWFPFDKLGLYVMPFLGLAANVTRAGSPTVGDLSYTESPVSPYPAIYLGWELDVG
jgi:hypothetical protein